ncbi:TPA: hypothetical protein ACH3X1_016144 [Trebouxia sp. C0004]
MKSFKVYNATLDAVGRQQDAGLQPEDEDMAESNDPSQDHDSTWRAPQTAVASETYGLLGCFADLEQSAKAPKQHLQQLMPGCDGSVLVKASALTIEQALAGGGANFSTMATEDKKFSRDSVVIMKDAGVYWAGRVRFFLSHMPPGAIVGSDAEVDIAHVHWYGKVLTQHPDQVMQYIKGSYTASGQAEVASQKTMPTIVSIMAVYRLLNLKAKSKASYDLYLELFDRLDGILKERSKTNLPSKRQAAGFVTPEQLQKVRKSV